jgi:hypothetical protein
MSAQRRRAWLALRPFLLLWSGNRAVLFVWCSETKRFVTMADGSGQWLDTVATTWPLPSRPAVESMLFTPVQLHPRASQNFAYRPAPTTTLSGIERHGGESLRRRAISLPLARLSPCCAPGRGDDHVSERLDTAVGKIHDIAIAYFMELPCLAAPLRLGALENMFYLDDARDRMSGTLERWTSSFGFEQCTR